MGTFRAFCRQGENFTLCRMIGLITSFFRACFRGSILFHCHPKTAFHATKIAGYGFPACIEIKFLQVSFQQVCNAEWLLCREPNLRLVGVQESGVASLLQYLLCRRLLKGTGT